MGVITALTATKRSQDYINIFIDNQFAFCLHINTIAEIGLYRGKEISALQIKNLVVKDLYDKVLNQSISNVSKSRKTESEIKKIIQNKIAIKILKQKKESGVDINELFNDELIEKLVTDIVIQLIEYGFINDELYAEDFIKSRILNRPRSKKLIAYELSKKGIRKEIIEKALLDIEINEVDVAREILIKKYKSDVIQFNEQKKIRFLASKGYNWDIIESFIKK